MNDTYGCVRTNVVNENGDLIDLLNPLQDQMTLRTISCALSKVCRFGGRIRYFYSVAEHLLMCANWALIDGCTKEEVLAVLMHDASEAFVGDVCKPLKVLLGDKYAEIEARFQKAIGEHYGIDFEKHHAIIKAYDRKMIYVEKLLLYPPESPDWGLDVVDVVPVYVRGMVSRVVRGTRRPIETDHEYEWMVTFLCDKIPK